MGILDDAIREHLDLKRRRGADPTEMEKLERDALGPVRRGAEEPETVLAQPHDDQALYQDAAPEWSEPSLEDKDLVPEPEPSVGEAPKPPSGSSGLFDHEAGTDAPAAPPPRAKRDVSDEPPTAETPAAAAAAPTPPPAPAPVPPAAEPAAPEPGVEPLSEEHLSEETAEYDVEAEHARERPEHAPERRPAKGQTGASGHKEDVLEETPEFLQDTPDHDRLWFEQRPPRNFDFDK